MFDYCPNLLQGGAPTQPKDERSPSNFMVFRKPNILFGNVQCLRANGFIAITNLPILQGVDGHSKCQ